jgi:multidrug resistance protein MdtO
MWTEKIWQDLLPTPGRLSSTLRIVLASTLTLLLLMILRVPSAPVGLYFVFLVGRDSPSVSVRTSIFSLFTLAAAVATELAVVILTDNDPVARLLSVTVVSFIAGMLILATTVPTLGSTWGFIFCTLIGFWEFQAPADALVKNSLWLVAAVAVSVGCSVAVEYVFGAAHPADQLQEQRRIRYQALEAMFTLCAQGASRKELAEASSRVARLAAAGQRGMQTLYNMIVDRNLDVSTLPIGSRVRISMLAQLMDVAAAFGTQYAGPGDLASRQRCARIAERSHELGLNAVIKHPHVDSRPIQNLTLLDRVEGALHVILSMPSNAVSPKDRELVALPSNKVPLLIPGGFKNKQTIAFALKISLCATFCYIFYHAVDWPGISTSVSTVLLAGLGTSAATKQKLVFRLAGAAIGGLILGLGATSFLFPHMDSIVSLVVLVAIIAFISAWCAAGRHFNYVGLQIAFAFYFVAFEGFSAPTELAPARDRLIGILVALVVMWFVFDQLWPVRTVTAMRHDLAVVLHSEATLFRLSETTNEKLLRRADTLRDQVGKIIAGLRTSNDLVEYELGVNREQHMRSGEMILRASLTAVALFWNQLAVLHNEDDRDFFREPGLNEMRRKLAGQMDVMAEAANLVDAALLEHPRYGEYARNAVGRYGELQTIVESLSSQV